MYLFDWLGSVFGFRRPACWQGSASAEHRVKAWLAEADTLSE